MAALYARQLRSGASRDDQKRRNHFGRLCVKLTRAEAIMKLSVTIPLLACAISLPSTTVDSAAASDSKNTAILEQGKNIFVAKCAKCHDNDANKKLPDGTTLLGRLAQNKDPESRLGTRLKDPQERHAVMIYVDSLLARLRATNAGQK
jgi:cytochrome c553